MQEVNNFLVKWRPYNVLWRNEKSQRELLNCLLTEFEGFLTKHEELESRLAIEDDFCAIGSYLSISTTKLKFGLSTEIKCCTHR